jgi:aminopeptidase
LEDLARPVERYARLLVERCLDVQPGWQVFVKSQPPARPLIEEVVRLIARRGAYPIVRLSFIHEEQHPFHVLWASEAPEELLEREAPLDALEGEQIDAWISIGAPENVRDGSELEPQRRGLIMEAIRPLLERRLRSEIPWVGCRYPTDALAQGAGMTLRQFEEFLYGACLLDWDAEGRRMERYRDRFDGASQVRIIGAETDLTLGIEGRDGIVDDGHLNMPGGEFFYSPVEDSAEGVISYREFPAVLTGTACAGVRLRFEGGRVVDASAQTNEEFLFATLDRDEGARAVGELGIGCNPAIQRHTGDTLFDEKIYGTVHVALGAGIPAAGGLNRSSVHWDMVKDLRSGGRIELDGEVVQEDGRWLV